MKKEFALNDLQSRDERIKPQDQVIEVLRASLMTYEMLDQSKDLQTTLAMVKKKCSILEDQNREMNKEITSLREKLERMKMEGGEDVTAHSDTKNPYQRS